MQTIPIAETPVSLTGSLVTNITTCSVQWAGVQVKIVIYIKVVDFDQLKFNFDSNFNFDCLN